MEITTERLLLREFVEDDWRAVLAYQRDPRYLRFYPWESRSEDEVRAFVRRFLDFQIDRPRTRYQLAVCLRGGGRLIGNCGVRLAHNGARVGDIGYELAPDEWGHGYATEAACAIVAFGFQELRLHRLWATCIAENAASARVMEKVGMRREGQLREHEWMKGRWWDSLLYGMLEHEWTGREPGTGGEA